MRRLVLLAACLLLAGCGGGDNASSKGSGESAQQTISISETEFELDPATVNVGRAGTVTFEVSNDGQTTHALELEGNGIEEETRRIEPGESATLTVQLDRAGSYKIYCPIDGHEDRGMKGAVRVAGSSGAGTNTRGNTTTDGDRMTTEDSPGY